MFSGYIKNSQLRLGTGGPLVQASLNYGTINGYQIDAVPIIQPYGTCALPPDNQSVIYKSLGDGFVASFVEGDWNNQTTESNLTGMVTGETANYNSTNFTRQLKLTGAFDVFTGAMETITTAAINGANTNKVLIDLCAEITALEEYINNLVTAFNAHIHSGVTSGGDETGNPVTPNTPYTPTTDFTDDSSFLNQSPSPNFIDNNGEVLTT